LRLNATNAQPDEFLIGFGSVAGDENLSETSNLTEAAARLFDLLHLADLSPKERIAVAAVPDRGIGSAINDRLRRASHAK
jgi:L-threonylcarbamoyladenylate synthase